MWIPKSLSWIFFTLQRKKIYINLALALGHLPLAFTHVILSDDIVANLGFVEPEHPEHTNHNILKVWPKVAKSNQK